MLLAIQWSREREFKKVLEIRPDTEAIHMNSYLMGKNDWLLEAFQHFGGERGLRNLQLREHLDLERRRNFNRAKVVSLVVSALHYHHVVLCAESPSYGRPSIKKAAEFVTKYESVNVTPATIQNEYWPRYQRSAAWIYAAMSFSRESDGQGIDQALEAGRLSTINRLLIGLAARARFVERLLVEIVENVPLTLTLGPPARPVPITSIAVPQFDEVRSRGYRELAIDRRFRDSAASIKDGDFR
jgi:hypothetical protein